MKFLYTNEPGFSHANDAAKGPYIKQTVDRRRLAIKNSRNQRKSDSNSRNARHWLIPPWNFETSKLRNSDNKCCLVSVLWAENLRAWQIILAAIFLRQHFSFYWLRSLYFLSYFRAMDFCQTHTVLFSFFLGFWVMFVRRWGQHGVW